MEVLEMQSIWQAMADFAVFTLLSETFDCHSIQLQSCKSCGAFFAGIRVYKLLQDTPALDTSWSCDKHLLVSISTTPQHLSLSS